MDANIDFAFARLKTKFGTHGAAAKFLGMTRDHYCALRNGRANIPARTAEYIMFKAQEAATLPGDEPEEGRKSV